MGLWGTWSGGEGAWLARRAACEVLCVRGTVLNLRVGREDLGADAEEEVYGGAAGAVKLGDAADKLEDRDIADAAASEDRLGEGGARLLDTLEKLPAARRLGELDKAHKLQGGVVREGAFEKGVDVVLVNVVSGGGCGVRSQPARQRGGERWERGRG